MLKVQRPTVNALKCGEVFLLKTEYIISCVRCKLKIQFNEFQSHFLNSHLTQAQRRQLHHLIEKSESEDPIGIDVKNGSEIKKEDEVNLKLLDEQPIPIEQIIPDDVVQDRIAGQNPSATTTAVATGDINDAWSDDDLKPLKSEKDDSGGKVVAVATATAAENQHASDEDFESIKGSGFGSSDDFASSSSIESNEETSFPCSICNRSYKSKKKLGDHRRQVHIKLKADSKRMKKKSSADPPFKCETCGDGFWEEIQLKRHDMKKHTGIKCDICDRSFSQIPNMERHRKRHDGIKDIKCGDCGKEFFTKKEMDAHALVHTRNYRKVCEICGKQCSDGGVLRLHMRRHTGERPYKCKVCGKGFFSGYDRNIHESGHSDERPYKCDICGGAFRYPRALRVHKKIHVKERNFPCHVCDKRFINEKGVKEHMRSHIKPKIESEEEEDSLMTERVSEIFSDSYFRA